MWLAGWLLLAWAAPGAAPGGSVRVTVLHGPDGSTPVSAVRRAGRPGPRAEGAFAHRSLIFPDGSGVSVDVDSWFERRDLGDDPGLSFEGKTLPVRLPPPPNAVAVVQSGPPEERLDLVFLAEGYTAEEEWRFVEDVDAVVAHLQQTEPYDRYGGLLNIWRVFEASGRSGIPHEERADDENVYGCTYYCGGIDRLICCDTADVLAAAEGAVPTHDGVMVLVNDPEYGGSGGMDYGASYNGESGVAVAAHELGHSLVGLWDEYSYGVAGSADGSPNCADSLDSAPWSHWMGSFGVGAFPTCSYTNAVRPTQDGCMMRTLQAGYCPVCREQVVKALYREAPEARVSSVSPPSGKVDVPQEGLVTFEVEPEASFGVPLDVTWKDAEGNVLGEGTSLQVGRCDVAGGELRAVVGDATPWVRVDAEGLLSDTVTWEIVDHCPKQCGCGGRSGAWPALALVAVAWIRRGRRR